ncbi:MAG: hypothetical protein DHS80DRAFT_21554 [Piptocephalis tieghemiana]|nr:MAG: hypothetical protein DHS80DRAFT_21554 [Piptocephalis tieghemiana]
MFSLFARGSRGVTAGWGMVTPRLGARGIVVNGSCQKHQKCEASASTAHREEDHTFGNDDREVCSNEKDTTESTLTAKDFNWIVRPRAEDHQRRLEPLRVPTDEATSSSTLLAQALEARREEVRVRHQRLKQELEGPDEVDHMPKKRPQLRDPHTGKELEGWRLRQAEQKVTLDGPWRPVKRLARSTMEKMRFLRQSIPEKYDVATLSKEFGVSFEVARRILRSRYDPSKEVRQRQESRVKDRRMRLAAAASQERKFQVRDEKRQKGDEGVMGEGKRAPFSFEQSVYQEEQAEQERRTQRRIKARSKRTLNSPSFSLGQRMRPAHERREQGGKGSKEKTFTLDRDWLSRE